jgi:hypothetical protein
MGSHYTPPALRVVHAAEEECSFLKKRTKKLLLLRCGGPP